MLPLVVQLENTIEHKADTLAFKKSPVRIGRNSLNDLQLDEPFVSQWHAVIRFSDARTSYLDLGSTNRTLIDGRPTQRNVEVPIEPDTDIRIGPLRLHVLRAPAPPEVFGRRRNSAFGQAAPSDETAPALTMVLGELEGEPKAALLAFMAEKALAEAAKTSSNRSESSQPVAGQRPGAPNRQADPGSSRGSTQRPSSASQSGGDPDPGDLARASRVYAESKQALVAALQRRLEQAPAETRQALGQQLRLAFPELATEALGREASSAHSATSNTNTPGPNMTDWLSRLTGGLFPGRGVAMDIALAMERTGAVLEVFAQAFIELRRAQEQFCREMSLEHYVEDTSALHHTDDPRALLAYLLASPRDGDARLTELSRALADFTLHQVGLIGATVEGGRKLVEILAPSSLLAVQDPPSDSPALGQQPSLTKVWPRAARKLWRRYLAHHYALVESDRFVRELFGREFARRYYAVTGGRGAG